LRNYCNRILVVDDNEDIHEDFRKILNPSKIERSREGVEQIEAELFDDEPATAPPMPEEISYRIDFAYQGEEAVDMVDKAAAEGDPFAMCFMDVRMPPGINGIETVGRIWKNHPFIEMVIVTAYSDYTWEEIQRRVGQTDRLMFLRKPFDHVTIKQMALALTKKYTLASRVRDHLRQVENEINQRRDQLDAMVREFRGI